MSCYVKVSKNVTYKYAIITTSNLTNDDDSDQVISQNLTEILL